MNDPTPFEEQLSAAMHAEAAEISATPNPGNLLGRMGASWGRAGHHGCVVRRTMVAAAAAFVVLGVGAAAAMNGSFSEDRTVKVGSDPTRTTTTLRDEPKSTTTWVKDEPKPTTTVKRIDDTKPAVTTVRSEPTTTAKPVEPTVVTSVKPVEPTVKPTTTTLKPKPVETTVKPTTTTTKPVESTVKPTTTTGPSVVFTANQAFESNGSTPPFNEYWGTANPGQAVKVSSPYSELVKVFANAEGQWSARVEFPWASPGTSFVVKIYLQTADGWIVKKELPFTVVAPG
ncbi:MAG TPA: hypothetical protein VF855_00460 [Acidimicrobiales bacterium]